LPYILILLARIDKISCIYNESFITQLIISPLEYWSNWGG